MDPQSEFFVPLLDRLQGSASVKNVYGDPISAAGKTVIPVARIAYGLGAGLGKAGAPAAEETGMGGGGGVRAEPLGVIEISGEGTRFISFAQRKKLAGALLLGIGIGTFLARSGMRRRLSSQGISALSASL